MGRGGARVMPPRARSRVVEGTSVLSGLSVCARGEAGAGLRRTWVVDR